MTPILKAAGIPKHQLDIIPKDYKIKTLAIAFDWLHNIYLSYAYANTKEVWVSVPAETWDKYELFGITDLTEQRLLNERSIGLRKLWKTKRPRLFINRQKELCSNCENIAIFTYNSELKQCNKCGVVEYHEQDTNC